MPHSRLDWNCGQRRWHFFDINNSKLQVGWFCRIKHPPKLIPVMMCCIITGQYLNLDKDHNGMLSKEELSRYGTATLTSVFLDRVFQECLTYDGEMVRSETELSHKGPGTQLLLQWFLINSVAERCLTRRLKWHISGEQGLDFLFIWKLLHLSSYASFYVTHSCVLGLSCTCRLRMNNCVSLPLPQDYKTYLDFVLALENRKEPAALQYIFKLLDMENRGYLNVFSLNFFFRVNSHPRSSHSF